IAVATLLNHAVAAWAGDWIAGHIPFEYFRWIVGGAFLAVAAWTLIPDKLEEAHPGLGATDAFIAATIAFFIAEIGDKTQVATVLLAAKYQAFVWVVAGTTLGMMLANVPSVLLGDWMHDKLPMKPIRIGAALLFVIAGVSTMIVGF
ncbi:MAG: TMEM165/GDT1 family protein, partial [Gammaproteobacteria bacterium]